MGVRVTLVNTAVVRRAYPRGSASRRFTERLAPVHALLGAEANASAGAGADVGRGVGQPREVLGLGGRHGEAHRCHGDSLGKSKRGTGGGLLSRGREVRVSELS